LDTRHGKPTRFVLKAPAGRDLHALRSRDVAPARNCLRQAFDVAEIIVDLG